MYFEDLISGLLLNLCVADAIVEEQIKLRTEKYQNDKPNPPVGVSEI